jgi:uncharacterized protein DUF6428
MQTESQPFLVEASLMAREEMSGANLLDALAAHRAHTLVFNYEGRDVLPGYHVTEVKTGAFQALDCGANYESWSETFIQLWDVPQEDGRRFMPVAKFLGIIGKVTAQVAFDPNAKLTFEVSDGVAPIALYRATQIDVTNDIVRVMLSRRPASCKPRDRWLEQRQAACCAPASSATTCCR